MNGFDESASYYLNKTIHLIKDEVEKDIREYINRFKEEDRPKAKQELVDFIEKELVFYVRNL